MCNKRTAFAFMISMMVILLYLSGGTVAMAVSGQAEDFTDRSTVPAVSENHVDSALTVPTEEDDVPPVEQCDLISDGEGFWAWLEAHKETGGFARLTNPVCLDKDYTFIRVGTETAAQLVVDTAGHTVTVTGMVDMWSNQQLVFRGQTSENGIFHVAPGGVLELNGIVVEETPGGETLPAAVSGCVLWQEEGAALVMDNCRMSGTVHYAQTPFVMYDNSVYAVARTGQTADDVLPAEIACTVNYQGTVTYRPVQVVWNLEGTQKQQEERLRFVAEGVYVSEASGSAPLCTVIYDDYPLTFTYVKAGANNGYFSFKGGYTRPEEYAPMTIASEYSFDGENWFVYDEKTVEDGEPDTFFMGFQSKERSMELSPYVYIRLRGEYNGTCYLSNVLCYASDSLSLTEEAGGNRGGGTSVVNPPDAPEEKPGNRPSTPPTADFSNEPGSDNGSQTAVGDADGQAGGSGTNGSTDNDKTNSGTAGNTTGTGNVDRGDAGLQSAGNTASSDTDSGTSGSAGGSGNTGNTAGTGSADSGNAGHQPDGVTVAYGTDNNTTGHTSFISAGQSSTNSSVEGTGGDAETDAPMKENAGQDIRKAPNRLYVAALCFITLSVIAGAAGFAVHAGIFRRVFHAIRRAWFR